MKKNNFPLVTSGSGVSLGETSITAYRGDRGKAAYDHISDSAPRTGAFVPATGIQLDRSTGTVYTRYTQTGVLAITPATGGISSGKAILEIVASGDAVTFPGMTIDPKSDDFDIVAEHVNYIEFIQVNSIVYYNITNLS